MKVNLDTELVDFETGENLQWDDLASSLIATYKSYKKKEDNNLKDFLEELFKAAPKPLTLGKVFRRCLLHKMEREEITEDVAQERFLEAQEMMKGGDYELSESNRKIITSRVLELYNIIVSGQIINILNQPSEKKTK